MKETKAIKLFVIFTERRDNKPYVPSLRFVRNHVKDCNNERLLFFLSTFYLD